MKLYQVNRAIRINPFLLFSVILLDPGRASSDSDAPPTTITATNISAIFLGTNVTNTFLRNITHSKSKVSVTKEWEPKQI